jgi:hypothetical protein
MRWERLFEDLDAEADGLERGVLDADVADRLRSEWSGIRLVDRLRAHTTARATHRAVTCWLAAGGPVRGAVREVGLDWVLLTGDDGRDHLLPLQGVVGVSGLSASAASPGAGVDGLPLTVVLRAIARDRAGVGVRLSGGAELTGTVDRVSADHLDLALHPPGEPRRRAAVLEVRSLRLAAVLLVSVS